MNNWVKEFPAAITVCDRNGIITEMNDNSVQTFEKDGGTKLIGKDLHDCHPEPAKSQLKEMLEKKKSNCYTIEKSTTDGVKKKLIYQSPWFENGEYKGLVEISFEIPSEMPHFVRA
jgi:transcriptional regulator with PAS, ATPase and Fis domain